MYAHVLFTGQRSTNYYLLICKIRVSIWAQLICVCLVGLANFKQHWTHTLLAAQRELPFGMWIILHLPNMCSNAHTHARTQSKTPSLRTWADRNRWTSNDVFTAVAAAANVLPELSRKFDIYNRTPYDMWHGIIDTSSRTATSYVIHSKCFHFHEKWVGMGTASTHLVWKRRQRENTHKIENVADDDCVPVNAIDIHESIFVDFVCIRSGFLPFFSLSLPLSVYVTFVWCSHDITIIKIINYKINNGRDKT